MYAQTTSNLSAGLLYRELDPLNFKHLATTLNLILEPAGLRFRVIHERAGITAVLSCRRLHVAIVATEATLASDDLQQGIAAQVSALPKTSADRLAKHHSTIEISVGTGPLPHTASPCDPESEALVPLLTQMVTNHLMNMNPALLVYWGETGSLMRPRDFLEMINGPTPDHTPKPPSQTAEPEPAPPAEVALNQDEAEQLDLRRSFLADDPAQAEEQALKPAPTFLRPHLPGEDRSPMSAELSGHVASRFSEAVRGPKAPFIVSFATIFVAPIVGILLVIYNFTGGARLKPTALMACLAAAVTLAADLAQEQRSTATAAVAVTVEAEPAGQL